MFEKHLTESNINYRPKRSFSGDFVSVKNILCENSEDSQICKNKYLFCLEAASLALESYLAGDYTKFDALTLTTCCHGIAIKTSQLLSDLEDLNIPKMLQEIRSIIIELKRDTNPSFSDDFTLPASIICLGKFVVLSVIKEMDLQRGAWKTVNKKIKEIHPISTVYSEKLLKRLQLDVSNTIAEGYAELAEIVGEDFIINGIPTKCWAKYVKDEHIRVDWRGRKYAPCLFSIQVCLSYLSAQKAKIAIICDLWCQEGEYQDHYIELLQGDGRGGFYHIENNAHIVDLNEPVVVFSGCSYQDGINRKNMSEKLAPWLNKIQSLILACDIHHPHYPQVKEDSQFNSDQIQPQEQIFHGIFQEHLQIQGVTRESPSLFRLTHIYVASHRQVLTAKEQRERHPFTPSMLPHLHRK